MTEVTIRAEGVEDEPAIRALLRDAFGASAEADLVEALRGRSDVRFLVALDGARRVGHVGLSPVRVPGLAAEELALGLAPLAVADGARGAGVGAALVRAALEEARARGACAVVVLGDPAYYARFGFAPAARFDLACRWTSGDAFQALELRPGALAPACGVVEYLPEFDAC